MIYRRCSKLAISPLGFGWITRGGRLRYGLLRRSRLRRSRLRRSRLRRLRRSRLRRLRPSFRCGSGFAPAEHAGRAPPQKIPRPPLALLGGESAVNLSRALCCSALRDVLRRCILASAFRKSVRQLLI